MLILKILLKLNNATKSYYLTCFVTYFFLTIWYLLPRESQLRIWGMSCLALPLCICLHEMTFFGYLAWILRLLFVRMWPWTLRLAGWALQLSTVKHSNGAPYCVESLYILGTLKIKSFVDKVSWKSWSFSYAQVSLITPSLKRLYTWNL